MDTFAISKRDDSDYRTIRKSYSKGKVPGFIIHNIFLIDNILLAPSVPDHLCIECTILLPCGTEDPNFTLVLFKASDVGDYLTTKN